MNLTNIKREIERLEQLPPPEPVEVSDQLLSRKAAAIVGAGLHAKADAQTRSMAERIGIILSAVRERLEFIR